MATDDQKKSPEKKTERSVVTQVKNDQENGARRALIEELFNDLYSDRRNIYLMNFFRGLFFGFGSVLGGTLLVAIAVWLLSQTGDLIPALAGFVDNILKAMNKS